MRPTLNIVFKNEWFQNYDVLYNISLLVVGGTVRN